MAGNCLRKIIAERGPEILKDCAALGVELKKTNCNEAVYYQILLLLKVSNLTQYIPQISTGISMIDINNIVSCAEKQTGLSKKTIKMVLSAIFFGLSLPSSLEHVVFPKDKTYAFRDSVMDDLQKYDAKLREIHNYILLDRIKEFMELVPILDTAVRAGHPEALYLKGLCFYKGFGTEEKLEDARYYLSLAAKNGSVRAHALLGDIYFEDPYFPDYDAAFKQYTIIGAVPLSEKRQKSVAVILQQKKTNIIDLGLASALWVLILVFSLLMGGGTFSYDFAPHWGGAICAIIFSTLVLVAGVLSFVYKKYNSIKWVIPVMMLIALLFAKIAI